MAYSETNLALGPGEIYSGVFGVTEPADTTINSTPGVGWTSRGGTQDGVNLIVDQKYTALEIDQAVDVVGRRLTSRDIQVETNLAELTLDNLKVALNGGTVEVDEDSDTTSYELDYATSATQPDYSALLIDAFGPASKRRRIIVRKTLSTDKVAFAYTKDKQSVYTVQFSAHYVTSSISPLRIVDDTSA
ncbi:hypothetical protein [Streptomyces californicus]|uniref:hypothetical protein n=1 Tax=Streptomyces californicus TaxID=67351 RepID=UPI0033CFA485